jgi:hypothetical protein
VGAALSSPPMRAHFPVAVLWPNVQSTGHASRSQGRAGVAELCCVDLMALAKGAFAGERDLIGLMVPVPNQGAQPKVRAEER